MTDLPELKPEAAPDRPSRPSGKRFIAASYFWRFARRRDADARRESGEPTPKNTRSTRLVRASEPSPLE
jgi:hypothetical protein